MQTEGYADVILVLEAILDARVPRIRYQRLVSLQLCQGFDGGDERFVNDFLPALVNVSLGHGLHRITIWLLSILKLGGRLGIVRAHSPLLIWRLLTVNKTAIMMLLVPCTIRQQ